MIPPMSFAFLMHQMFLLIHEIVHRKNTFHPQVPCIKSYQIQ
uniref:Uncharacterized protein n=1 Tax=Schistosoma curassoni TaxID=6186 RepID=A0A183JKV5_9TREM